MVEGFKGLRVLVWGNFYWATLQVRFSLMYLACWVIEEEYARVI